MKSHTTKRHLTKKLALAQFLEFDTTPRGDHTWRCENWNNFTDDLCKNGDITLRQYESWTNPF